MIWGCGGHAREVNFLCEQIGQDVIGFLDERFQMKGAIVDDVPVLGDIDDIKDLLGKVDIICTGVGDPALRRRFFQKTRKAGFDLAEALIHPSVSISKSTHIGKNSIVCEGVVLTVNIKIGEFVIINRSTTIGHDTIIGDYVTVSPGVNISGNVKIGDGAYIGTGTSIREKVKIGDWSVVGGGAFVKDDVPEKTLYAGVPAILKKLLP